MKKILKITSLISLSLSVAEGAVTITFSGVPGTPTFFYDVSGSIVVPPISFDDSLRGGGSFRLPILDVDTSRPVGNQSLLLWDLAFWREVDGNPVNPVVGVRDGSQNPGIRAPLSSPITVDVNGVTVTSMNLISFENDTFGTDGDIDVIYFHEQRFFQFPAANVGDVVSVSGNGTFTYGGNNIDEVLNEGVFSSGVILVDGSIVEIHTNFIPEPSSLGLLTLSLVPLLRRRR